MSDAGNKTNVAEILGELNAGVFEQQINRALSDVALGVVTNGKAGEVTIKLAMKQISDSTQVAITHKLTYVKPTMRGKISEETSAETPMYVGGRGELTIFPDTQAKMNLGSGAATGRTDGVRA